MLLVLISGIIDCEIVPICELEPECTSALRNAITEKNRCAVELAALRARLEGREPVRGHLFGRQVRPMPATPARCARDCPPRPSGLRGRRRLTSHPPSIPSSTPLRAPRPCPSSSCPTCWPCGDSSRWAASSVGVEDGAAAREPLPHRRSCGPRYPRARCRSRTCVRPTQLHSLRRSKPLHGEYGDRVPTAPVVEKTPIASPTTTAVPTAEPPRFDCLPNTPRRRIRAGPRRSREPGPWCCAAR